jgi:hypothetical protein
MGTEYSDHLEFSFTDITFLDFDNIIAVYGYNGLVRTSDGGKSWIDTNYFDPSFNYTKIMSYGDNVFVGGASSEYIGISRDKGNSWNLQQIQIEIDSVDKYENIYIFPPKEFDGNLYLPVFLLDEIEFMSTLSYHKHCLYLKSTDSGETWENFLLLDEYEVSTDFVIHNGELFLQATDYTFKDVLVNKPNGDGVDTLFVATPHRKIMAVDLSDGTNRTIVDTAVLNMPSISNLDIINSDIMASANTKSYKSSDFGKSWFEEKRITKEGEVSLFFDLARTTSTKGMAVGLSCFATLEPATSVSEHNPLTSEIAVYPNPAGKDDEITIDIKAHEAGKYTLQLTALDGSECNIKQTETLSAGLNRVSLNENKELASGIYILSIYKEGQFVAAQKVVISE